MTSKNSLNLAVALRELPFLRRYIDATGGSFCVAPVTLGVYGIRSGYFEFWSECGINAEASCSWCENHEIYLLDKEGNELGRSARPVPTWFQWFFSSLVTETVAEALGRNKCWNATQVLVVKRGRNTQPEIELYLTPNDMTLGVYWEELEKKRQEDLDKWFKEQSKVLAEALKEVATRKPCSQSDE